MSLKPAPGETGHRKVSASVFVLGAAVAALSTAYPLGVRELARAGPFDSALLLGLLKLPPLAIDLALAAVFGATLRQGREPLIARFARLERGSLEPDLARHTRLVTALWTIMFLVMAAICALLMSPTTTVAWQWWTTAGTWCCVAGLFVGERVYRKHRYSRYSHASLGRQLLIVVNGWRSR